MTCSSPLPPRGCLPKDTCIDEPATSNLQLPEGSSRNWELGVGSWELGSLGLGSGELEGH